MWEDRHASLRLQPLSVGGPGIHKWAISSAMALSLPDGQTLSRATKSTLPSAESSGLRPEGNAGVLQPE